jgi:hypothetical protein
MPFRLSVHKRPLLYLIHHLAGHVGLESLEPKVWPRIEFGAGGSVGERGWRQLD